VPRRGDVFKIPLSLLLSQGHKRLKQPGQQGALLFQPLWLGPTLLDELLDNRHPFQWMRMDDYGRH